MNRKYKMVTVWDARVDGRCFQTTEKPERAKELLDILNAMYPNSEVTVTPHKERRYIK